jgi:hypothetical protein
MKEWRNDGRSSFGRFCQRVQSLELGLGLELPPELDQSLISKSTSNIRRRPVLVVTR